MPDRRTFTDTDGSRWLVERDDEPAWRHAPADDTATRFVLVSTTGVRVPIHAPRALGTFSDADLRAALEHWRAGIND